MYGGALDIESSRGFHYDPGGRVYGGALDIESSRGFHYDPGGGGCMVEHLISKAVGGSTMIPGPLLI